MALCMLLCLGLIAGCGEPDAATNETAIGPPVPSHPSGASPEDLELLDWLQTIADDLRSNDACFRLSQCGNLSPPGENFAPSVPAEMAGCFSTRRAACEQHTSAIRALEVPAPFRSGLAWLLEYNEHSLCNATAEQNMVDAHPEVLERLRRANHAMPPAMRGHVQGWEGLGSWAAENERLSWAADFRQATIQCTRHYTRAGEGLQEINAWLRERFFCAELGCCTVERVGVLRGRGVEPGPPRPECSR